MNLKLDENLPESLLQTLSVLGHDVDNVRTENIVGQTDQKIWKAAQDGGRFLITQDPDFSDIRKFAPGTHHGLMLVRLRVPGRLALAARIGAVFQTQEAPFWARCFVLLTDHKLRVHQPSMQNSTDAGNRG
jgi:Uncharacterized protein conserved in bacteria